MDLIPIVPPGFGLLNTVFYPSYCYRAADSDGSSPRRGNDPNPLWRGNLRLLKDWRNYQMIGAAQKLRVRRSMGGMR
jgi:hypothetical protein